MKLNKDEKKWLEFITSYINRENINSPQKLATILSELTLKGNRMVTKNKPGLRLSTFHASKGLEFDAVLIIRLNDTGLNYSDADFNEKLNESYVAISRAKKYVLCSAIRKFDNHLINAFT